jgi:hypothetical protein
VRTPLEITADETVLEHFHLQGGGAGVVHAGGAELLGQREHAQDAAHGSFFLAPLAIGFAALADVLRRRPGRRTMLVVLVASTVATCLTPFGPEVWRYAVGLSTNPTIARLISEWQRTSPVTVTGALFYASVIGAVVVVRAARRDGAPLPVLTLAWLAGLAFLGAYAERGVAWWAFGAPVALAPVIASLRPPALAPRDDPRRLRILNVVVVAALLLVTLVAQPLWRSGDELTGPDGLLRDAPGDLARALSDVAGPSDRAVVPQPWASWFEWASPGVLVMVDSRVEVVPAWAWTDNATIVGGGQAALAALERIAATVVVVDTATQSALDLTLRTPHAGWRLAYEDDDGLVFALER